MSKFFQAKQSWKEATTNALKSNIHQEEEERVSIIGNFENVIKKKRAKKEIVNLKPNSNLEGRSSIKW
jgi:hypothetical protein